MGAPAGPPGPPVGWAESAALLADAIRGGIGVHSKAAGDRIVGRDPYKAPQRDVTTSHISVIGEAAEAPYPDVEDGRLRILAVTSLYPRPGHETIAPFNLQQFRALAAEHELSVIAPVLWTEEVADRCGGRRTPARRQDEAGFPVRHPTYYYPPKVLQSLYGECYQASLRREFERAVAEFRPDVVLGCYVHPDGWATARLAHRAGLPVVVKAHGSSVLVAARRWPRRSKVAQAVREADGVVAVSRDLAKRIIALGAEPDRVRVVYNGIDTGMFRPGDRAESRSRLGLPAGLPTVLFVGNILRSKGAEVLVEACALMAGRGLDFACHLVGRGRDSARVQALAARRGLSGRVSLAGPRPFAELPDWYRACDVVALPSFSEGVPNVLREARACGVPFVATRVGGIPEVAEPGASLLVAPGSASELADALAEALAGRMGARAGPPRPPVGWAESAALLADALRQALGTPSLATAARRGCEPWPSRAGRGDRTMIRAATTGYGPRERRPRCPPGGRHVA